MNWKVMLKHMKLEDIKKKHFDFFILSGGYKLQVKPYSDNSPNELKKAVKDYIKFLGGSTTDEGNGRIRFTYQDRTGIVSTAPCKKILEANITIITNTFPGFLERWRYYGLYVPEYLGSSCNRTTTNKGA